MIKNTYRVTKNIFLGKKRVEKDIKINEKLEEIIVPNIKKTNLKRNKNIFKKKEKISKILFSNTKNSIKYKDFKEGDVIIATEDDFQNPLSFFDKLLNQKDSLSGVIKILPPKEWKKNYSTIFEKVYKKNFLEKDFKLETRLQNLKNLFLGKVKILVINLIKKFQNKTYF